MESLKDFDMSKERLKEELSITPQVLKDISLIVLDVFRKNNLSYNEANQVLILVNRMLSVESQFLHLSKDPLIQKFFD